MTAVMKISVEFNEVGNSETFSDYVTKNIVTFLSIDLSQFSLNICPVLGLTTPGQYVYRLAFLVAIYISWFFLYGLIASSLKFQIIKQQRCAAKVKTIQCKLVRGFVEIVKYTYSGFCEVTFASLVCISLGPDYVWWHDATNVCLETWQLGMVLFLSLYAIPLPFVLLQGMKLMKEDKLTATGFAISCIFPPLVLYLVFKQKLSVTKPLLKENRVTTESSTFSQESEAIISVLQGPYREDEKHMTLYWEAMVSIRRLLMCAMTLVSYASIRMMILLALCGVFLSQHIYLLPFKVKASNSAETLSLFLLLIEAAINLLRASLTDSGVVPSGPSVPFFKGLEMSEKFLVVILVAFIIVREWKHKKNK